MKNSEALNITLETYTPTCSAPWPLLHVKGCLKKKVDVFIGAHIHGFTHPVFSPVCIGRLGQGAL